MNAEKLNAKGATPFGSRAGFTMIEIIAATAVFSMAISVMMGAYLLTMQEVGGDSLHVRYIDLARSAEQKIVNLIQGLENVLRFLEKWSEKTVTFRGSIIDIWYSEIADADWSYGSYYTAPNRNWGYDLMYRTSAPPGIPRVFGIEELAWRRSSWEEQGWDGTAYAANY